MRNRPPALPALRVGIPARWAASGCARLPCSSPMRAGGAGPPRPGAVPAPGDWAADKCRELPGVPGELAFAARPRLAAAMLQRARGAGMPARWVAAGEVYGGRDLRTRIRELGYDYAIAVPAGHRVTTPAGRLTVTSLLDRLPADDQLIP